MGFLGFGKKKVNQKYEAMKQASGRMESKDTVEAGIAIMVGASFADNTCSDAELETLQNIIDTDDAFENWKSETTAMTNKWIEKFRKFKRGAIQDLHKELADLKSDPTNAKKVLLCGIAISEDDDGLGDKERDFLTECANVLGLRLDSVL